MEKQRDMNRFTLYAALFLLVLLTGCGNGYELEDYSKVEAERSNLVLGLVSYMSLGEVKAALRLDSREIFVVEDSNSPKQVGVPPFNILKIKISNTEIRSFKGSILLTFFNDRLMSVRFYPVEVEDFIQSVDGLSKSEEVEIKPFTRVWFYTDHQGADYIGWVDTRLQQQFDAWIKSYS
jgi:hypothetical protein